MPEVAALAPADAPNVLLISLDTLRADAIEPYGQARPTAPAMTAMAEQGVVFENSWAQAPSTSPTHASMFTGVWPAEHGIMGIKARLPLRWNTLAEHFYAHGFRTWSVATSVRFAKGLQLDQGFEQYEVFMDQHPTKVGNKAMEVALEAIPHAPGQPWFGFVHLLDVHAPYGSPEPHQSRYLDEPSVLAPTETVQFIQDNRYEPHAVSERQLSDLEAMYAGGVSFVDTRVQQLMDAVSALDRPTIVVLTADHGEAFFEKSYLGHGSRVWEPVTRVPLILWAPGLLPGGERRSTLAQSIDLFPTLASMAGLPAPEGVRGIDLAAVARGDGEVPGRTVLLQSDDFSGAVRDVDGRLIKMVQRHHAEERRRFIRMYDLALDPHENQRADAKYDAVRDELVAFAAEHHHRVYRDQREEWEASDREEELLRAIGYIE